MLCYLWLFLVGPVSGANMLLFNEKGVWYYKPIKIQIYTIPQGNNNLHSDWYKASLNWMKQLDVCFSVLGVSVAKNLGTPPPYTDPESKDMIYLNQDDIKEILELEIL